MKSRFHAFCAALAVSAAGCSGGSEPAPPGASGTPSAVAPATNAAAPAAPLVSANLAPLVDLVVEGHARIPRADFDPAELVKAQGKDPNTLFLWVRDQTSWVPYRGLLRGARGVMLDRVGSSLDRAVLLAALLRHAEHSVRLARADLPETRARQLLDTVRPMPDRRRDSAPKTPSEDERRRAEAILPGVSREVDQGNDVATARLNDAASLIRAQATQLLAEVQPIAPSAAAGSANDPIAAIRDHWWVELYEAGKWIPLDVLLPAARMGEQILPSTATFEWPAGNYKPPAPPDAWHTVNMRVVIERREGAATSEAVVLETILRPADTIDRPIVLTHMPWPKPAEPSGPAPDLATERQAALDVKEWVPILSTGHDVIGRAGFNTLGDVRRNVGSPIRRVGGMDFVGGTLGGGDEQPALTAEWIEYEIRVPGRPTQVIRREVFDLIGPARRAAKSTGFDGAAESVRLARAEALAARTDIMLQAAEFTRDYVEHLDTAGVAANRDAFHELARVSDRAEARRMARTILNRIDVWGSLTDLAVLRSMAAGNARDWFIDRPNILHHRLTPNYTDGGVTTLIDIATNGLGTRRGAARSPFQIRLEQGVVDTVAEVVVLNSDMREAANTASLFSRITDARGRKLIGPKAPEAIESLGWPDDAAERVRSHVGSGYAVVVSTKPLPIGERARVAWWRVDPASGETIGVMDSGFHQAAEQSQIRAMVAELQSWLNATRNLRQAVGPGARVGDVIRLSQQRRYVANVIREAYRMGWMG